MDWEPYINRSQGTLLRLIAVVFASIGLGDDVQPATLSRALRAKVLYTLRPAESGLRRLVYVLALEMERNGYVPPRWAVRAAPEKPIVRGGDGVSRVPAFRLIDPRKFFEWIGTKKRPGYTRGMPNISFFDGYDQRVVAEPVGASSPDDALDAKSLCNRLLALKAGLEDIPKQAKRMLRLKARDENGQRFKSPMRPGLPPGWRRDGQDEIDEVLRDCHSLANWARQPSGPG